VRICKMLSSQVGRGSFVVLYPASCSAGQRLGGASLKWAKAQQSCRFLAPLDAGSLGLRSPVRSNSAVLVRSLHVSQSCQRAFRLLHAQTASEVATSLVSLYPLQTRLLSIFNQGMGLCLESDMCRSICLRFRINLQVHNCISTPCQMLVQAAEGASDPHKLILRN